jgi:hypothetical protein
LSGILAAGRPHDMMCRRGESARLKLRLRVLESGLYGEAKPMEADGISIQLSVLSWVAQLVWSKLRKKGEDSDMSRVCPGLCTLFL